LLIVEKFLFFSKTNTRRNTRWAVTKVIQKVHEKKRNAASSLCCQSVQSPCHIVFKNCRCACKRSSCRSDLKICLFSETFPISIAHHDCLPKISKFACKNIRQSVPKYRSQAIENKIQLKSPAIENKMQLKSPAIENKKLLVIIKAI